MTLAPVTKPRSLDATGQTAKQLLFRPRDCSRGKGRKKWPSARGAESIRAAGGGGASSRRAQRLYLIEFGASTQLRCELIAAPAQLIDCVFMQIATGAGGASGDARRIPAASA